MRKHFGKSRYTYLYHRSHDTTSICSHDHIPLYTRCLFYADYPFKYGMGLQTAVTRKLNVAGISTTVLTSTLANLFEDLAQRISHREKEKLLFSMSVSCE